MSQKVFPDSCPGRNKNRAIVRLCMAWTDIGRFCEVKPRFPIREHSFISPSRRLTVIKHHIRKCNGRYSLTEYFPLICNASISVPLTVKMVNSSGILDLNKMVASYVHKSVNSIWTASAPRINSSLLQNAFPLIVTVKMRGVLWRQNELKGSYATISCFVGPVIGQIFLQRSHTQRQSLC
jgi:hypothetical protein